MKRSGWMRAALCALGVFLAMPCAMAQETLKLAGVSVPTWVVTIDRKTRPGSTDQSTRSRTYWFDPARRVWVKWKEKMHGERKTVGFTFTYDTTYEAVLSRFAAA